MGLARSLCENPVDGAPLDETIAAINESLTVPSTSYAATRLLDHCAKLVAPVMEQEEDEGKKLSTMEAKWDGPLSGWLAQAQQCMTRFAVSELQPMASSSTTGVDPEPLLLPEPPADCSQTFDDDVMANLTARKNKFHQDTMNFVKGTEDEEDRDKQEYSIGDWARSSPPPPSLSRRLG